MHSYLFWVSNKISLSSISSFSRWQTKEKIFCMTSVKAFVKINKIKRKTLHLNILIPHNFKTRKSFYESLSVILRHMDKRIKFEKQEYHYSEKIICKVSLRAWNYSCLYWYEYFSISEQNKLKKKLLSIWKVFYACMK